MVKTNFVIGLLALAFFANAQYQGWNLFERDASQTSRVTGSSGRSYHK
jgi:TRAP-type C4-dicarboxylate transport system permease small subunit